MCFSATASFVTTAVLISLGCYALKNAFQFNKKYLVLAFIPLLFALQQFFEGLEWLCFSYEQHQFLPILSLLYLFFAFFLWPAYFSFKEWLKYWGVVLFISYAVSYWFFYQNFASVWCFFAAILSILIVWIVPRKQKNNN